MTKRLKPKKKGVYKKAEWLEFVRFTAFPRVLRNKEFGFETDKAFGAAQKINHDTLVKWKKDQEFWDAVAMTLKKWGKDRTPDVIMGLYRNAVKSGNAAEAKLWLQYFEDWKEKNETDLTLTKETLKAIQDNSRKTFEMAKQRLRKDNPIKK